MMCLSLGRGCVTFQGAEPPERAQVFWILLLRDHVQYFPHRYGL